MRPIQILIFFFLSLLSFGQNNPNIDSGKQAFAALLCSYDDTSDSDADIVEQDWIKNDIQSIEI